MSARDFALVALDATILPNWRSNLIRKTVPTPTDPRDLALAEQIRVGVIKNLLLLQQLTVHHSGRALKSIDPLAQKIMAIALYQLRFLTRVPASAAVNEAVEQTARFGRARAKGFVNAALRKATREPDPKIADPSVALSHPRELFDRLVTLLGREDAIRFAEHDNREPPTLVRLLDHARVEDLQADGVTVTPHEQQGMYVVEHAKQATLAEWSRRGIAQVQDVTAARVVEECDVQAMVHAGPCAMAAGDDATKLAPAATRLRAGAVSNCRPVEGVASWQPSRTGGARVEPLKHPLFEAGCCVRWRFAATIYH